MSQVDVTKVNPYASAYLREVFDELRFLRYNGYRFQLFGAYSYDKYWTKYNGREKWGERTFVVGGTEFELSKLLSINSQLRFKTEASAKIDVATNPSIKQEYEIDQLIEYSHELTDKFLFNVRNNFNYIIRNYSDEQGKRIVNNFNLSFDYFLEDYISIGTTYSWKHYFRHEIESSPNYTENDHNLNIGVTYFFMKEFQR